MSDYPDQSRNLNPTPAARWAMANWGSRYAAQRGGSMDFWDGLSDGEKRLAQSMADEIIEAAIGHGLVEPAAALKGGDS